MKNYSKYLIGLFFPISLIIPSLSYSQSLLRIDESGEWISISEDFENCEIRNSDSLGGVIDLMGNGGLMLSKSNKDSLFSLTSSFIERGKWVSKWINSKDKFEIKGIKAKILVYGQEINMNRGWTKFDGNPLISGGNILLPLNHKNVTSQTIILKDPPGGVPQDQSIFLGTGRWKGKWVLMFNHTPKAWPEEYYWSFAFTESLAPLKLGKNPFIIDEIHFPLFGPINNQAPNDWLSVNGVIYAPDETHESMSHLWKSDDMISWVDLGVIKNKTGTDPGLVYDGKRFHLFSENGNLISHCYLNIDSMKGFNNKNVLDVGDHTGDADVAFFNNRWHMFVDDGIHLKYKISYASTTAEDFPYGWILTPEIYGPHNPDQNQGWDDDSEEGNNFGTGDADIALEGNTLYLFTERAIGVAYKEIDEIFQLDEQQVKIKFEFDSDGDGVSDSSTPWNNIYPTNQIIELSHKIKGESFRIVIELKTFNNIESPIINSLEIL